ncbi:uncharacterized protein TrAtP1_006793 [Trichoderma atroviride]|uniref:uncharacterized protein n=1 Tax=Hypocrea atroviridis TaxID=63577 RepID=UPI003324B955|nr:hypothetical protein TrAtP1_006793 [Trichoderma atroviride]
MHVTFAGPFPPAAQRIEPSTAPLFFSSVFTRLLFRRPGAFFGVREAPLENRPLPCFMAIIGRDGPDMQSSARGGNMQNELGKTRRREKSGVKQKKICFSVLPLLLHC